MLQQENAEISDWVRRFAPLIAEGGSVLDLACGRGRHSRYLAGMGCCVEALDRDPDAIAALDGVAGVTPRLADVEGGPWPYHSRAFDAIVVTNYLYRPLLPLILNALETEGVLIYETFMVGNEQFGKPTNPAYLLRSGELLDVVRRRLTIVAFEQGEISGSRQAVVQRLCAVRAMRSVLPPA
jgi:SAM-dependent methyltransferase